MKPVYIAAVLLLVLALAAAASAYLQSTSCVEGNTHTSDAQNVLPLRFGGASTDLWNVKSAGGVTRMCYQPSGLSSAIDLTNIVISNRVYSVVAYPHIGYGFGEFDTSFGQMDARLSFPMPIATFDSSGIYSSVSYSLSVPEGQPMDFAYDLWIEGAPQSGHRALLTDFEVMVWLYNQTMRPAGSLRGTFSTSAVIDGRQTNSTWLVYATAPSPSFRMLVTYLLSPTLKSGSISMQLRDFVDDAMSHYWHPTFQVYYLMGIELGTEFEASGGSGRLSWTVSSMEIRGTGPSTVIVG